MDRQQRLTSDVAIVTWETDDIYDTKYENRQGQMARVGCNNSVIETRNVCALCISVCHCNAYLGFFVFIIFIIDRAYIIIDVCR